MLMKNVDENDIEFVDRQFNPQNCPQARPIETLWAILKNMVYDQGWEAKNIDHLK
jgi:transposase